MELQEKKTIIFLLMFKILKLMTNFPCKNKRTQRNLKKLFPDAKSKNN